MSPRRLPHPRLGMPATQSAQQQRQPVQRLPAVGWPVGLLDALDDPIYLMRGLQQLDTLQ